jgi:hypothetical protein
MEWLKIGSNTPDGGHSSRWSQSSEKVTQLFPTGLEKFDQRMGWRLDGGELLFGVLPMGRRELFSHRK